MARDAVVIGMAVVSCDVWLRNKRACKQCQIAVQEILKWQFIFLNARG